MNKFNENLEDKSIELVEENLSKERKLKIKEITKEIIFNNEKLDNFYNKNKINFFNNMILYDEINKKMNLLYIENIKLKYEKESLEYLEL